MALVTDIRCQPVPCARRRAPSHGHSTRLIHGVLAHNYPDIGLVAKPALECQQVHLFVFTYVRWLASGGLSAVVASPYRTPYTRLFS